MRLCSGRGAGPASGPPLGLRGRADGQPSSNSGHAGPSTDDEFEEGYTPERWLNRDRIGAGITGGIALLLLAAFVVIVIPALMVVGCLVVAVLVLGVGVSTKSKR